MDCRDGDDPQISVALDRYTGSVEEAVSSRWPDPSKPGLHSYLAMAYDLAGQKPSQGQHTPVLVVNALLWSRGFERADRVLSDINVDTLALVGDRTLVPLPMCSSCRAILSGVSENGSSPAPTVMPVHERCPAPRPRPRTRTAQQLYRDDLDHRSPPELRRLARVIEEERGNTAILVVARDPALPAEAALDALLANPPSCLADVAPDGGGFLRWPEAPTAADLAEIDVDEARAALSAAICHDLAYDDERVGPMRAAELADAVIGTVDPDCRWWTNSNIGRLRAPARPGLGIFGGWNPLTQATFDAGVIGVGDDRILIAWVMDED